MENSLLAAAAIAVLVAIVATLAAIRAGRTADRAADRATRLLEPAVSRTRVSRTRVSSPRVSSPRQASSPDDSVEDPGTGGDETIEHRSEVLDPHPPGVPQLPGDSVPREPVNVDGEAPEPRPARIPVLDLDRLRAWMTLGDVQLGRLAVVSVELDNLSAVRERRGDAVGSQAVEAITQRLRTVTRPKDVVAHVSRDRFVLVCRDVPDAEAAERLTERVAMAVAHPSIVLGEVVEATASIGAALAGSLDERPEDVLRRAITAGNHARRAGGARITISAPATPPSNFGALDLSTALAQGELLLHYLPIVSCATGRIAGFEALVRWNHPKRGLLSANEFLPDAERTDQVVPIGAWVLEQACRQMARWHADGGHALKLSVNLSGREFTDPKLIEEIQRILRDTGLAPGSVWIELTEEALLADHETTRRVLTLLREVGVRLIIDDFGTGASSLVSLKQFPIDAIKIAHTFVADLGRHRDGSAICRAIVDLAHSLELCTIAEGVEALDQLVSLRSLGCELAQGHLFGVARPADEYGTTPATSLRVTSPLDVP